MKCEHGEFTQDFPCWKCGMIKRLTPWAIAFGDRVEQKIEEAARIKEEKLVLELD